MQRESTTVAPALKALLENFIDYAGIFPPAALTLDVALDNYSQYLRGNYSWMLNRLVVSANELPRVPEAFDGCITLLSEVDDNRAGAIESKGIIAATHPVYCEVALDEQAQLDAALDAIKQASCFAKFRAGGVKPEAIPTPELVSKFILACAHRKLPFKATAGLHHPVRSQYALTYEANAPKAVMHGFLNVLLASAFAWHGERQIEQIIAETDRAAFVFDKRAHWKDKSLSCDQIRGARLNFMHSVGSCSFVEPVADLQTMGLI
jgi:hypothetical protein